MNLQIQKKFIDWYFNEPFPGPNSNRNRSSFLQEFLINKDDALNQDNLRYWLEQAFHRGARAQMELIKEDWYRQNKDAN